jgi:UDP-GlcNAc:undecaprenyl-phosphate GlcNAc-1-phosphate transferase
MLNYLIVFGITLGVTALFVPLAHILGKRMNAWDAPDGLSHTSHVNHVTRTGGIAITAGIYAGLLAAVFLKPAVYANGTVAGAMAGAMVVFVTGLLDDIHEIKPWLKAVMLVAACLVTSLVVNHVELTGLKRLDFILAVLILMGGTNAFNLMDGMDGLASGMAVAASLGLLAVSRIDHAPFAGMAQLVIIGAALGFLAFNRPRAKIFMGDSGSLVLGFSLSWLALTGAGGGPERIIPVMLVMSPFILDTGLAIVRRQLNNMDIFTGDRRHVYDLLHSRDASVWRVDLKMWGLGLAYSALGFSAAFLDPRWQAALLLLSWAAFGLGMVRLGMFEAVEKRRLPLPSGLAPEMVKVLVVDDDPNITKALAVFLTKSLKGCEIRTAADGFAAGQALAQGRPDLVILDILLPGLDGFGVCRQIKALDKNIKVIAISGNDTAKNRRKMKEAGADAFLGKPFRLEQLLGECDRLLKMGNPPVIPE